MQGQNWWQGQFQNSKKFIIFWPEKCVASSATCMSVAMFYLVWGYVGYETFFTNSVPSFNFAYSTTVKPRP